MPAFNLDSRVSKNQVLNLNINKKINHSKDQKVISNMTQILNIPAVKDAVKRLSNE